MLIPLNPSPVAVYPAGLQGPLLLRNISDTDVSVSPISSPYSGFAIDPGGSLEWPALTPLYAYGEPGSYLSIGAGSGLTATPFIPAPIVNVTVPDVIVPPIVIPPITIPEQPTPTTPNADEDTLRVLAQPQIDAMTSADKSTNFTIWNTTTNTMNYVVNGVVIAPSYGGAQQATGTYTGTQINPNRVTVGFKPDLIVISQNGLSQPVVIGAGSVSPLVDLSDTGFTLRNTQSTTAGLNLSNLVYNWAAYQFQSSSITQVGGGTPTPIAGSSTALRGVAVPGFSGTPITVNLVTGLDKRFREGTLIIQDGTNVPTVPITFRTGPNNWVAPSYGTQLTSTSPQLAAAANYHRSTTGSGMLDTNGTSRTISILGVVLNDGTLQITFTGGNSTAYTMGSTVTAFYEIA